MTLGTHVAFASVLYLGGATLFGYRPDWVSWALAAVASGLPDVDLPPAKIGRLFWFVSMPLERRFGSSSRSLFFNYLILNGNFLRCNPDYTEKILINQDTGNCCPSSSFGLQSLTTTTS